MAEGGDNSAKCCTRCSLCCSSCWSSVKKQFADAIGRLDRKCEKEEGQESKGKRPKPRALAVVVLILLLLVWVTLVVVFDFNRFHGYCAKREFNDSIGPPFHVGDRTICRVENESYRPSTPGKLPGEIFTGSERSRPSWIVIGVLSFITVVMNFILLVSNLVKDDAEGDAEGDAKGDTKDDATLQQTRSRRTYDHYLSENQRISWIIFGCTATIIVDYNITVGMIIECREDKGAELFYTFMLCSDVLVQGTCSSGV